MRHKTHMGTVDPEQTQDAILAPTPLCRQKARTLLPPAVTADWQAVTCERCLGHRPPAPVGWVTGWLRRFMARVRG